MARPKKELEDNLTPEMEEKLSKIALILADYGYRIGELEKPKEKAKSIHKVEEFNDEQVEDVRVTDSRMKFSEEDTISNIRNIIKIMPPNLVDKEGKQSYANIRALGGPHLTDEVIDKAYEGLNLDA